MIRTQINLEEEQYRILTLEAQRQNRSVSALIRETIDKQLVRKSKKGNAKILLELAKNAVDFKKINPETPDDLIENMDEYLYGRKSEQAHLWKKTGRKK